MVASVSVVVASAKAKSAIDRGGGASAFAMVEKPRADVEDTPAALRLSGGTRNAAPLLLHNVKAMDATISILDGRTKTGMLSLRIDVYYYVVPRYVVMIVHVSRTLCFVVVIVILSSQSSHQ